ncbi:MAG: FAD-binding protein [Dehalococcoidales bacterium]|nr:FAD-binding protein [Dehalococcoidales bacterium]
MNPKETCDVLVVGWGGAGSAAAISACDAGADVILIEKSAQGGGSTALCLGSLCIPTSMEFADYLDAIGFKTAEREVIDTYTKVAMDTPDFIKKLGGDLTPLVVLQIGYPRTLSGAGFPKAPKAEFMRKMTVTKEAGGGAELTGPRLWNLLKRNVESRKIRVMTNTPAKELVKNDSGEIIGVIAERAGEKFFIKAKKAVILTAGGYENNNAMLWEYYASKPIKFLGNPLNTGDAIRMLQKAGAAMWHMTNMVCSIAYQSPEFEAAFPVACCGTDFLYVDKHGKRFMCEATGDIHEFGHAVAHFDTQRIEFPAIPAYIIFGEQTRKRAPLFGGKIGNNVNLYKWSLDNSAEIAKGWIIQAKNPAELAKKIPTMDPATIEATIAKFNEACKSGKDAEFKRAKEDMSAITGPFYAIPIHPALFCTQGGGRRDKEGRVLDPDGKPIPRLYEAGELGAISGWLYQGSTSLADCIIFGQISGKNAAAEKSIEGSN